MIKRIGIECQNLEGERFGVGQTLIQLLKSLPENSESRNYRFILYFNQQIPDDPILNNPIFEKKILRSRFFEKIFNIRFNIFYHILIPIAYHRDRLNGMLFPSYMMPAFFMGKSITVLTNDVYYESHYGNLPFKYKLAYRIFCWLAAKRSNRILSISEFSKKELAKLYKISPEKISVISWGLNDDIKKLDKSPENIKKINTIKQKFGIKDRFILSVGQAFPRRKIRECMMAFEKIASDLPDIQYVVANVDKYNPPIIDDLAKKINSKLGRQAIIRANYLSQEDILHLFNDTELLIYISSNEAMGLPPMEAVKCGSVPLVADNELTHEMLGDNAFFVSDTDNVDIIAKEMKSALTNNEKRQAIEQTGPAAMQKFSWSSYGGKLMALFKEVF